VPKDLKVKRYLASTLVALERYQEALAEYQALLAAAPEDTDSVLQIAYIYAQTGKAADAVPLLEKALAEQPGKPELYLYLANAYMDVEKYQQAVDTLSKGFQLAPDRDDLLFSLAIAYEKQGKRDEMIATLKKTLELKPDHADALNYLGYTYAEKGENLDEAIRLIKRALLIKPKNGYILDSLAWAYYQKGMLNEALEVMKEAVAKVAEDPVMREHYGDIFQKLAKRDKAKEQWLKSLGLDPKNMKLREKFKEAGFGNPDDLLKDVKPGEKGKK
jgi:tetratricopeptide (TPR) repeat protein